MTVCKVLLYGLKPSDINYRSNNKVSEVPFECQQQQRQHSLFTTSSMNRVESTSSPEADHLNLHIKPLTTSTNSVRNNYICF